jgi:hypothetical protein
MPSVSTANLMSAADYRESLRRYKPVVYVDGRRVESVADEPAFRPGINAIALTYDHALKTQYEPLMTAVQHTSGKRVNRLSHLNTSAGDLLNKLEAVRLVCQETGCAQRYLTHDALNAIAQVSARIDDARGGEHTARFLEYLHRVQDQDLTLGVAMTDAKGDRSRRPHEQANVDSYVHVVERNARGIVISGTKAIVTGAPYVHELLVMPCRNMGREDADFAVCCAVPLDAPGLTIVARPAGRPGEKLEHGDALFSRKYGQSTGVCIFDRVLVPHHSTGPDATLTVAYAASVTERIHFMLAHRPGFVAPTLAARQFASLDQFSGGRLAVHYISGGSDDEQKRDGDWLDHDQRYARTDEYLELLHKVWQADKPFDHEGAHYRALNAFSEVKPRQTRNGRPHVPVYFGGASEAAIPVAGKYADVYALGCRKGP